MKERILELMNKILEKVPQEKFQLIGIEDSGNLNEIQYRIKIKLKYDNKENFCILFLKGSLDELNDDEVMGALVHELSHFFSPKSTLSERKFMLLSELIRQTEIHKNIRGSRFLQKLMKKRDAIYEEIGGKKGLDKSLEDYQKEEDATDLRAIRWGFETQIKAMRKKSKTFYFWFRFAREN
jgi:hypothetical protein